MMLMEMALMTITVTTVIKEEAEVAMKASLAITSADWDNDDDNEYNNYYDN